MRGKSKFLTVLIALGIALLVPFLACSDCFVMTVQAEELTSEVFSAKLLHDVMKEVAPEIVVFRDTVPKTATEYASLNKSGTVKAYYKESTKTLYVSTKVAGQKVAPDTCCRLFEFIHTLTTINFSGFDTSNVTDMNEMFFGCESLNSLDLSDFDTGNVVDMTGMFCGCKGLNSLNLSGFNTRNVTGMYQMFSECYSLTSLDLSSFDTGNVTDMSDMFLECTNLTSLDLSSFDTKNVIYMGGMFYHCYNLTSLDLSSFDTGNVISMSGMFEYCTNLTSLNLSAFETRKLESIQDMFTGCDNLSSLDLSAFCTVNLRSSNEVFKFCDSLKNMTCTQGMYDYIKKYKLLSSKITYTIVSDIPYITMQPEEKTVVTGETVHFSIYAKGTDLTYQWQRSKDGGETWFNTSFSGAQTNNLRVTTKLGYNDNLFRCVVKDSYGRTVTSSEVKLTVMTKAPVFVKNPCSQSLIIGQPISFQVEAKGTDLTYQWQRSTDGGKTWGNSGFEGAKTNTLTATAKQKYDGWLFRCKVTDSYGRTAFSSEVELTVMPEAPVITTQPVEQSVSAGQTATFKVAATGTGLTYQWQKLTTDGTTWVNSSSTGATTDTLSLTAKVSYNGLLFLCIITDSYGRMLYSQPVRLYVTAITTQPASKSVAVGQTATFKVAATGEELTYQWQKSTNGGTTWVNSSSTGAKTNTLSVTTKASFNGLLFRCVVTDRYGNQVISSAATLTVKVDSPVITTQPTAQSVTVGQNTSFKVAAVGDELTYQWQKSTDGGSTWVNSSSTGAKTNSISLTAKISFNGWLFRCVVTDRNGKTATSSAVKLTVK